MKGTVEPLVGDICQTQYFNFPVFCIEHKMNPEFSHFSPGSEKVPDVSVSDNADLASYKT